MRIQWDPERSLSLQPLPHRAIQIGLAGPAATRYVDDWAVPSRSRMSQADSAITGVGAAPCCPASRRVISS